MYLIIVARRKTGVARLLSSYHTIEDGADESVHWVIFAVDLQKKAARTLAIDRGGPNSDDCLRCSCFHSCVPHGGLPKRRRGVPACN